MTPNGIPNHVNRLIVDPPQTTTVTITMINVVVRIICLETVNVFLMDNAKAMAPLSPDKNIICCKFKLILVFLPKLSKAEIV